MQKRSFKTILTLLLALTLVLPAVSAGTASAAGNAPAKAAKYGTYNSYFSDSYSELAGKANVFETLTYHQLWDLFNSNGTYVVLFGGAWDEHTQAVIGYINDVAKDYGVRAIYNFDTRLDGETASADIADSSSPDTYRKRYVELVNQHLTNLELEGADKISYSVGSQAGEADRIESPYLFVYNRTNDGGAAPIVSDLQELLTAEDFLTDGKIDSAKVEAYKAKVREVFEPISKETDGKKTASHSLIDNESYFRSTYSTAAGRTVFTGSRVVFQAVTYDELKKLQESSGDYAILYGGPWCPNTQPVIDLINQWAIDEGIQTVYTWDTRLDNGFDPVTKEFKSAELHVRDVNHPNARIYVDLVNQYLPNITTANSKHANGNPASPPETPNGNYLIWYGDAGSRVYAKRLQVPYVFTYNKDNVDATGAAAPIYGHVELMYTWANIEEGHTSGNRDRFKKALSLLSSRQETVPTGLTTVNASSSSARNGQITGVSAALEYKANSSDTYLPAAGTAITGLAAGTYQVRYKAKTGYNAGATDPVENYYEAGQSVDVIVGVSSGSPSPGGGDPGPSTPSPEPTTTPEPSGSNGKPVAVTLPAAKDATSGITVAVVSEEEAAKLIEAAKQDAAAGKPTAVELNVKADSAEGTTQVTLTREDYSKLIAGSNVELKVNAGFASIVLDSAALTAIGQSKDSGDISFIIAKSSLTEEGKEVLGDRPVYDLSVFAGETSVSEFGGSKVLVSIPYRLQAGEDAHAIIVYHVTDEGELHTVRGQYSAAAGAVEFATTHFSQYIIGYNKVEFSDVPAGAWYSNAVTFLAARDITNGSGNGEYNPGAAITRGQFIVLLLKAYGIEADAAGAANFSDAGSTYYTGYLAAAKRLGITTGTGDNQFKPNAPITRQDLFTLLHRALEVLKEVPAKESNASTADFSDAGQIAAYAKQAFEALVAGGVVSGSDGQLAPGANSTRAQVAQVLYNLLSAN
ncbi:S-layer homology domain-containing protein [Paenibacillus pinisoli]|uniref:S-layer homology domain-containing protein n=1 Tax=Paenibacillus pinisoli TaxID=1276110 RepID=A0A3A6PRY3_9BACL|nr:S-layer homology domain-containing protein [Paenibacillus pinisoli]RJX38583.1 S-layer homology domain-containing protein [Paenibacillus pinisoli]